jgi:hypothetical protein
MKRLYTFGCSVTQFIWPTWADILGREFDSFENWGKAGSGNLYIFNSVLECIKRNNLTNKDTVIIMWSGITRVDYYHTNDWQPQGGDFNLVKTDIRGHEIINFAYMEAIKVILDKLKIPYKMFSMSEFVKDDNVYDFYKNTIDLIEPSGLIWSNKTISFDKSRIKNSYFFEIIKRNYNRNKGSSWPKFDDYFVNPSIVTDKKIAEEIKNTVDHFAKGYKILSSELVIEDSHPGPLEHLRFLQEKLPEFLISQYTIAWTKQWNLGIQEKNYIPFATTFPKDRL